MSKANDVVTCLIACTLLLAWLGHRLCIISFAYGLLYWLDAPYYLYGLYTLSLAFALALWIGRVLFPDLLEGKKCQS